MCDDLNYYPVKRLNANITKSLDTVLHDYRSIIRLDEKDSRELMQNRINEIYDFGWRSHNLCEFNDKIPCVNLSMSFAQMVWFLCYVALFDCESKIIIDNFSKDCEEADREMNIIGELLKEGRCNLPPYLLYVYDIYKNLSGGNKEEAISLYDIIRKGQKIKNEEYRRMHALFDSSYFCTYVNSVYQFAISFCLLHEFGHYKHNDKFVNLMLEEKNADDFAIASLVSTKLGVYRQAPEFGMTAFMCCHLFYGIAQNEHPDIDDRLHSIIDALKGIGKYNSKLDTFITSFVSLLAEKDGFADSQKIRNSNDIDLIFEFLKEKKKNC